MKRYNLLIYSLVFIFLYGCFGTKEIAVQKNEDSDIEYLSIFTEATKFALLGNMKSSMALYLACIDRFPEKSAPYYQASNIYLSVNNISKAKEFAKKAIELDDSNKWYLIHISNIFQYENNLDSLVWVYEKIVDITKDSEYKYSLANLYSMQGNYKKSMRLIKELESDFDGTRELLVMRHKVFDAMNMPDSAILQLEHLIKLFPDNYENYGLLAEYLSEVNRFEHSRKIYEELLTLEPNNGLANISFGDFFIKQGKKDTALIYYKKGFASEEISEEDKISILYNYIYDPVSINTDTLFVEELLNVLKSNYSDYRPYTLTAEFYIKRQKFEQGLEELKRAIELDAKVYLIWEQFVMLSNYLHKFDYVLNIYEEGLELFPNQMKFHLYSAYSLNQLKKYNEVIDVCRSAINIEKSEKEDKIEAYNFIADAYRGLGEYIKSDSTFEEVLKIDPDNLLIRNNYSYYLSLRSKDLKRAEELSRLTIEKEPKNSTYLDTYGWILFKMGDVKSSLRYIELSIKNGAYNSSDVLNHYGDIMNKLNRCNEAIEAWEQAISIDSANLELEKKINEAKKICNE